MAGAEPSAIARLDELTRRLRRECPWDREQDERSIVAHTVSEAYELADAAHSGDNAKLLDELGDLLFQVHFLSLLLEERGAGDLAAVADHCAQKLIRRHPHVFGDVEVEGTADVRRNWDEIKRPSVVRLISSQLRARPPCPRPRHRRTRAGGGGSASARSVGDRGEIARAALLEQQREEVNLEQQVAELVEQLRVVAGVRGVGELVGLRHRVSDDQRSSCSRSHGHSRRSRRVSSSSLAIALGSAPAMTRAQPDVAPVAGVVVLDVDDVFGALPHEGATM